MAELQWELFISTSRDWQSCSYFEMVCHAPDDRERLLFDSEDELLAYVVELRKQAGPETALRVQPVRTGPAWGSNDDTLVEG